MRTSMFVVTAVLAGLLGAGCEERACTIDGECRAKFGEGWTCDQGEYVCFGPPDGADAGTDAGRDDEDPGTGDAGVDAGTKTCAMACPTGQRCVDGACACDVVSCPNGCCREGVCGPLSECGTCGNCTWSPGPEMHVARVYPAVVPIDHRTVLVTGGLVSPINKLVDVTRRCELVDIDLGVSTEVGPMLEPRGRHLLVNLDGFILACGGYRKNDDGDYQALRTCERFDLTTRTWSAAPSMLMPRDAAAFVEMVDGFRLLVTGGVSDQGPTAAAEIFDVRTGEWTAIAPMSSPRVLATAIRLPMGRIAVVGGAEGSTGGELYDPTANTWEMTGPLTHTRYRGAAARGTGSVVIAGGSASDPSVWSSPAVSSSETLIGNGEWTPLGSMNASRMDHSMVRLRNQRLLAVGGHDGARTIRTTRASTEVLEASGDWSALWPLTNARSHHSSVVLPDGRVVLIGGTLGALEATPSTEVLH